MDNNPWRATTLEWTVSSPPAADDFGPSDPVVYRGAYEFSVPEVAEDFVPQHVAAGSGQGSRIRRVMLRVFRRIENVTMPGTTTTPDIEIIVEDIGGGGRLPPSFGGGDDGDGSSDDGKRRRKWPVSPKRYSTAIAIGIVAILMFFMALASAFIVLRSSSRVWLTVHLPPVLWANTCVLLASSFTLEAARRRLSLADVRGFRKFWMFTTVLGFLFVAGQLIAWRQLVAQGIYIASNQASSFFYIFTGAHAVHLLGGVCALLYVLARKFKETSVSRSTAAEIASYYWHFMDGLWVFLLALLYLGK